MPLNNAYVEESLSTTDEDTKILLYSILNLNLQDYSNEKLIINTINKLLSLSKTRLKGLEFLNMIIANCSKLHIIENANVWISYCLIKHTGDNLKEVKLSTIGNIIENVHHEQEFNKKFVSDYISKIFDSCVSTPINSHEAKVALETLTICMKYYSSWFTSHKEKVESFVLSFLESPSETVVEKTGLTFLFLQQVGSGGLDGINHRTNFSKNFHKVCATVHKLFDNFFENEVEIDNCDRSYEDVFIFSDQLHTSQKMLYITAKRLTNCLKFLKIMLLKRFPVAKDIRPMEVLDVISRGIALHHCLMDKEKSLKDFQFSLLLNRVQIQLLQLLRIFIIWLQESSLPFSFTISKILIDALKKTQSCQCFTTDSSYQEAVYKVLGCWLRVCKNSFHVQFQTQLVACILKDISPVKTHVTLSLQTDVKCKSAKAKHKLIQDRIISSGNHIIENVSSAEKCNTEKNCLYALEALRQLLIGTTLKVKTNILQGLYITIINSILDIQTSKVSRPYTSIDCQEKLYEVLVAFYEQETLKLLPPLQLAIDVFNKGISNRNRHIAITCEHGLSVIEKLCQPICPSLFIPEMYVSEKYTDKGESVFDKQVVDELTEKTNGFIDNESESVSETATNINVTTETNVEKQPEEAEVIKETDVNIETGINDKIVTEEVEINNEDDNEENTSELETVTVEKSIHIIDVKVVKTSVSELELRENEKRVDYTPDTTEDEANREIEPSSLEYEENVVTETNNLKVECTSIDIVDNDLITSKSNIEIDTNVSEEPPSKRVRTEEETFVAVEIKEELRSSEEIDDTFEEDGAFVNEVKEF